MDSSAYACGGSDDGPTSHWAFICVEDREGEVCGGPADGLECEESDEGREEWVVGYPSLEEAACEEPALEACQDGLPNPPSLALLL